MSLILAVEPDRRQAAHLTHVVRQRVGAELVLAETTELALASIGNRVPDLILVPPLLSPQDDAALAAALRVIASAAHVQMVTTPMFASASPEGRGRGVLSAFRRSKPKAAPDGCDPAEFAQQISSYLESAAEKRADAQFVESPVVAPVARPEATVTSSDRYVPLGPGQLYRDEGAVVETASEILSAEPIERIYEPPAFEPPQQVDAAPVNEDVPDLPIIEALHDVEDTPVLEDVPVVEDVPVLEAAARVDELELVEPDPVVEQAVAAAPAEEDDLVVDDVPTIELLDEETTDEAVPMLELVVDNDRRDDGDTIDLSSDFDELEAIDVGDSSVALETLETIATADDAEPEVFEIGAVSVEPAVEDLETLVAAAEEEEVVVEEEVPRPRVVHVDALHEFAAAVEALTALKPTADPIVVAPAAAFSFDDLFPPRQPVEPTPLGAWHSWAALDGMTAEPPDAPVPAHVVERAVERPERPDWVQLVESLRLDVERRRAERPPVAAAAVRPTPSRPVQDEWGLFDPAQCGFAALLAKLDEITHTGDSRPRPSA